MPNRDKQDKFVRIVADNPQLRWDEAAIQAGYSKKRAKTVASQMRRHAGVQAKIQALRNHTLQAAPTLESYHATRNAAKEMALRHGDSTSAAWILLQVATMEQRELQQAEPEEEKQPPNVTVSFVPTLLPEAEAAAINRSAAEFEAMTGMPQGAMGRLMPESQIIEAQATVLKPVQQINHQGEVLQLPISDEERKRLSRLCLPVGGALRTHHCRTHGAYECIWQRSASGEWGWSDCPACWQKVN